MFRALAGTSGVFAANLLAGVLTGIVVARSLGPVGRGQFAVLMAAFGLGLALASLGQTSSSTFFVARDPRSARSVIQSARRVMVVSTLVLIAAGTMGLILGLFGTALPKFALIFLGLCLIGNALSAPTVFALQGSHLGAWNKVRLVQPLIYFLLVLALFASGGMSVTTLAGCLALSVLGTVVSAEALGRPRFSGEEMCGAASAGVMLRFGLKDWFASAPTALLQNVDKFLLIGIVGPSETGLYAVALSVVSAAGPLGLAISSVAFPAVAASNGEGNHAQEGQWLVVALLGSAPTVLLLAGFGQWLVPLVFGIEFSRATVLLWPLGAAAIFRTLSLVGAATLKGRGYPGRVAVGQYAAFALMFIGMLMLVPQYGIGGGAICLAAAEMLGFAVIAFTLRVTPFRAEENG